MNFLNKLIIAIDFDGTIVEDRYPGIGKTRIFAFETLKKLLVYLESSDLSDSEVAIEIRDQLNASVQPCAEYSSMAIDFLSDVQ